MPRKITPTVAEAVSEYMHSRFDLAPNTVLNDRSVLHRFAHSVGSDRRIGYVTARNVQDYFREIADTQKPSSYNKVLQRVGGFVSYCRCQGWVRDDLVAGLRPRRVPHVERLQLPPDDLVRLLDVPYDPRDRAFIATAMNTALRSSEIKALRIRDVDLENGELYVYRQKTSQDDRLPLTATHSVELRRWLAVYRDLAGELDSDAYLFPARRSPRMTREKEDGIQVQVLGELRPHVAISHPHRIVQRALRGFGIFTTTQEGLHTIRRSVARAFFESAADRGYDVALRATATLLGHKYTQTTEIYLGLSHDRRRRDAIMRGQDFLPFDTLATVSKLHAVAS